MYQRSLRSDWERVRKTGSPGSSRKVSKLRRACTHLHNALYHASHHPRDMLWCCIQSLPWRRQRPVNSDAEKSPGSSTTEPLDLASDEGSSVQEDLWRRCVAAKTDEAKDGPTPFHYELSSQTTFQSALAGLTDQYTAHGFVNKIPKVKAILSNLQPFVAVVSTMIQANPGVAALVWGSTQLILSVSYPSRLC